MPSENDGQTQQAPTDELIVDVFIDDAGNTGDHPDPVQTNMFLGGVVIPGPRSEDFWRQASDAWEYAKGISGSSDDIELKGSQLYGGREMFKGVAIPDRKKILDLIFEPIVAHQIKFFWEGVPKHMWHEKLAENGTTSQATPLWKSALFTYCHLFHDLLDMLYEEGHFRVLCDENSWVRAEYLLIPPDQAPWPRFTHGGVMCDRSDRHKGLQVADLLVHTIYRANKASCAPPGSRIELSEMDKLAQTYVEQLTTQKVLFLLLPSVETLRAKRDGSANP